jgi:2-C-methyl-D-erythritol 2,4-cyclodiphosphate synthase
MLKVGLGYDIHPLAEGRRFVLGGIEIPFPKGPLGHSDGDAVIHAIIDALLGTLGEGDIGGLFPDDDPGFKDVPSLELLEDVMGRLRRAGGRIVNLDTVIVAEEPRLAPHVDRMKTVLRPVLGLGEKALNIKAKTNEKLGPVGEGNAVACWAVALVEFP